MNVPSINPQLRKTDGNGNVTDYVFMIRGTEFDYKKPYDGGGIADIECYINGEWNQEETMKAMSVENARQWWHTLVHYGYERILTP